MTGTDSAGVPWGGRSLPRPGFSGDDGGADPALQDALHSYAQCRADGPSVLEAHAKVLDALASARLLVPVVAVLDEAATGVDGLHADKSTDMALVTLAGRDGSPAVPAFTSFDRLMAWRADARPVPAEARRVAVSAVAEGASRIVLDPAGPITYVVERAPLWGLGQGRPWCPPSADAEVLDALARAVAAVREVVGAHVCAVPPSGLALVVELVGGLDAAAVDAVVKRLGATVAEEPVVAERVDGLALRLVTAGTPPPSGSRPLVAEPGGVSV